MKKTLLLLLTLSLHSLNAQVYDTLVWADEFNGTGGLDTSKWWHQTLLPNAGQSWWNGEIQHYTNRDTNSYQQNGALYLTALKESFTDQNVTKDYTSARLNSKFAFTYGRVEVRAQLPTGVGTWPAIWLLGQNITEVGAYWYTQGYGTTGWPACGEIDIMEHWGHNQDHVSSAMHTPSSFGGTVNVGSQYVPGVSNSMHVYALEWTPTKMVFTVDSVEHYTYEPSVRDMNTWPFDDPQYLLFNIAIQSTIDSNFTSSPMIVDYVRVYQSSQLSTEELKEASVEVLPNPASNYVEIVQPYEHATAQFTDLLGKVVLTQESLDIRTKIDVSSLAPGSYIARITDAQSGASVQRTVVVQ
ncbi:MAG: family 16 glycosylhydrolase [Schleiferiaceae bacterium]|jgi:beta-glucanase (GH16 family)|nr:family 16 glycosylhydrolase [Schleiferiaceae bacterium]MDP4767935.1 family 16 glycosylhydrolase [Schleiferiaceae bacterium]MDP4876909.1 family 16 glycosylhydrolase [Schleiferiaceae bacterium]MDP4958803.1 family 16 glycosylhydrolase [Schleiferiaceae bacterium]